MFDSRCSYIALGYMESWGGEAESKFQIPPRALRCSKTVMFVEWFSACRNLMATSAGELLRSFYRRRDDRAGQSLTSLPQCHWSPPPTTATVFTLNHCPWASSDDILRAIGVVGNAVELCLRYWLQPDTACAMRLKKSD